MISRTAVLVGEGSLLVHCASRMIEEHWSIAAVVSDDPTVAEWARARSLPVLPHTREPPVDAGLSSADYLFSIGNLKVLRGNWLAVARAMAINFHDGPLPRLRGLNVPIWALIRRERDHAVSWHVLVEGIDEGDLLEQEPFEFEADDTALTVNAKCFDAGMRSFDRLLASLAAGTLQRRPQAGSESAYFGRRKRPFAAGFLDPRRDLQELDALVRALDFGPYENPFCLPWAWQAGAAIRIDREHWQQLRRDGLHGLGAPSDDVLTRLGSLHEQWCVKEAEWRDILAGLDPLRLPTSAGEPGAATSGSLDMAFEGGETDLVAHLLAFFARRCGQSTFDVALTTSPVADATRGLEAWFETAPPLRITLDDEWPAERCLDAIRQSLAAHASRGSYLRDLRDRYPRLKAALPQVPALRIGTGVTGAPSAATAIGGLAIDVDAAALTARWTFDGRTASESDVRALQQQFRAFLAAARVAPGSPLASLPLFDAAELGRMLGEWNGTARPIRGPGTIVEQFAEQVARTPDATAVVSGHDAVSWRELDRRSAAVASDLRRRGLVAGERVGILASRTPELVVALFGVLRAGGAYVPLDPSYPEDRLKFMVEDSASRFLVTDTAGALASRLGTVQTVLLGGEASMPHDAVDLPLPAVGPADVAYVIYTSGSTGKPKGVMVEHRNVVAFFSAMDDVIGADEPGVWLAVTSLSFDISVLELVWTLCRGFKVVLYADAAARGSPRGTVRARMPDGQRRVGLSLYYFASDEGEATELDGMDGSRHGKYQLLLEGAKFADRQGFDAVWTPERHFHAFGGLYPNPAVTSAAIAAITTRVGIRAGSVVMPLHHPVRVAEDFSVVDNLSGGRVGIAFASGWHPNDFIFYPQNFAQAKQALSEGLQLVRRLWRGETVEFEGPGGRQVPVRTLPRPVQRELPYWITTAGNPDTFRLAATMGANVLTHLLGQTTDEVAAKIRAYREAWKAAGHPGEGQVSLMLHTFVGADDEVVRETVREPMKRYLGSSLNLVKQHAWSFPAFKGRAVAADTSTEDLFKDLSPQDLDALLEHSFERYFDSGALFGSLATCRAQIERLRGIGVDEIACLIDFGVERSLVARSFEALGRLHDDLTGGRAVAQDLEGVTPDDQGIGALIRLHGVTHLQCTPSMASLLVEDDEGRAGLGLLRHLLVGGEALPRTLADRLLAAGPRRITNMYGPTETTIWSLTQDVSHGGEAVPIGRPIANTQAFILDGRLQPVVPGDEGELCIAGAGVARGYLGREALTAERFVLARSLPPAVGRVYRTGDLARQRADGVVEFLGRLDHQVKLRGHRIELGEIEHALAVQPDVRDAVVVLREDAVGGARLVGYLTRRSDRALDTGAMLARLRDTLPAIMVPATLVVLDAMPMTPNRKVDRKALPAPGATAGKVERPALALPQGDLEQRIAVVWRAVLGVPSVGVDDNFFDLGGHSLLTVQVLARLRESLGVRLSVTDMFRYPTIAGLARKLAGAAPAAEGGSTGSAPAVAPRGLDAGAQRAAARRAALAGRGRGTTG